MTNDKPDPDELSTSELESATGGVFAIANRSEPIPDDGRTVTVTPVPDDGRGRSVLPIPNDGKLSKGL